MPSTAEVLVVDWTVSKADGTAVGAAEPPEDARVWDLCEHLCDISN